MIIKFSHRAIILTAPKNFFTICKWIGLAGAVVGIIFDQLRGIKRKKRMFLQQSGDWSIGIFTGTFPLILNAPLNVRNPVLTAKHITDIPAAFVADPFLAKKDGMYYMFFEIFNVRSRKGEIGFAVSVDGLQWEYKRVILEEPFHLSYPYVFTWEEEYFMIPESSEDKSIRLYKAINFPTEWAYVETLLKGAYVDTTLLYYEGKWWMFTAKENRTLFLYYADTPMGPWVMHPLNPMVQNNIHSARPAGRIILTSGRIFRCAQDCSPYYGHQVRVFEITALSTKMYAEQEVRESPIIKAGGQSWNKKGMHTVDVHEIRDKTWLAAVDGFTQHILVIGY